MSMRIRDVSPNISPTLKEQKLAHRRAVAGPGTDVQVGGIRRGPISMETSFEAMLAAQGLLEETARARKDGFDGVFIDCFVDPALRAARELASIPVMGAGLAAMLFAMALGDRFSVITVANAERGIRENVRAYGFQERLASIRCVEFSAFRLYQETEQVLEGICQTAKDAVEVDGADVIVLGCTAMSALARPLGERLGIPVIDPAGAGLKLLVDLVELGLCHSKRAYPDPPDRRTQIGESGLCLPDELARIIVIE